MCQNSIEVELDKRGGKNFGPPGGKKMTIFMDDLSMPEVNHDDDDDQTKAFRACPLLSVKIVVLTHIFRWSECRRGREIED